MIWGYRYFQQYYFRYQGEKSTDCIQEMTQGIPSQKVSTSHKNLLEMQIICSYLRPTESDILRGRIRQSGTEQALPMILIYADIQNHCFCELEPKFLQYFNWNSIYMLFEDKDLKLICFKWLQKWYNYSSRNFSVILYMSE